MNYYELRSDTPVSKLLADLGQITVRITEDVVLQWAEKYAIKTYGMY